MSTSDNMKRKMGRIGFKYLLASLFCVLLGAVYEHFSHEVYSFFMIYAFVFPLAGGALPFLAMSILGGKRLPRNASLNLYHCGIFTLTLGSLIQGVLEIYGTTNNLLLVYWLLGVGLVVAGALFFSARCRTDRNGK